ncbi:MAG: hypothetical protein FWD34_04380 [Oscillospiraceae bacterium]|nr:hypothetical protein [Oscillospiraceae bacterium]
MEIKKVIVIFVVFCMLFVCAGCNNTEAELSEDTSENANVINETSTDTENNARRPMIISASFETAYTLEQAIEFSDLIADITITEWLGESSINIHSTFFTAQVNTVIKGEHIETITLKQFGNSKRITDGYPVFKNGDRMIVFLKGGQEINEQAQSVTGTECDNAFWIIGEFMTLFYISEVGEALYAVYSRGTMSECLMRNELLINIDGELKNEVIGTLRENNPSISESEYVFNYNNIAEVIMDIASKGAEH